MSNDVRPYNESPVLFCEGVGECKQTPRRHQFTRADPMGNGSFRLVFTADCCGHERVFGIMDPQQSGKVSD